MLDQVAHSFPPETWANITVLAAISGGPDSMGLLRALHALKIGGAGRLVAAHFNHGTRGAEAAADEALVLRTCRELQVTCELGRAAEGAFDRTPDGFEQAARTARYRFLEETAARLGARYIVTGHTADDQAETILHRILRGTGLAGLAGIPATRAISPLTTIVRPLLGVRRAEVLAYLAEIGQPFREDTTNADPRFTRNRLRHELLPMLTQEYNPQVVEALLRVGSQAAEAREVIDELAEKLARQVVSVESPQCVVVSCDVLGRISPYLVREMLISTWRDQGWPEQAMTHEKWQELAALVAGDVDSQQTFPGRIRTARQGGELRLWRE